MYYVPDNDEPITGLDLPLGLYELTDLFHAYYTYHNDSEIIEINAIGVDFDGPETQVKHYKRTLSRYEVLRKVRAAYMGSRTYGDDEQVALHKPNISPGYMKLLLTYAKLPFKSVFTDSDVVKLRIDKTLYNEINLSEKDKEKDKLLSANNPAYASNAEISDDISDRLALLRRQSAKIQACEDMLPLSHVMNGITAFVHSDLDWEPEPVDALDLVTEPYAEYKPCTWSAFFRIRRMTVSEIKTHIQKKTKYWNTTALKWALENAAEGRGILGSSHYEDTYSSNFYGSNLSTQEESSNCSENFTVKSFYNDKGRRVTTLGQYYGHMLVVEGFYLNTEGKVNKVIFFPSNDFLNVSNEDRKERRSFIAGFKALDDLSQEEIKKYKDGDVLFFRKNLFDSMDEAITVIPIDRDETTLERQRGLAFDAFPIIDALQRLDMNILHFAMLMGIPFFKDPSQGTDAAELGDLEINTNGDSVNLGQREFAQTHFQADLNAMLGVRQTLLGHLRDKFFLGGLDGFENLSSGRGANLANLRLVRDGRVYKHYIEDYSKGLRDFYRNIFRRILALSDIVDLKVTKDPLLTNTFYKYLFEVLEYPKRIFDFKKDDVVEGTGLPYWMDLEVIRNGASHFGAAELVLYSEIKQVFGDGLTQSQLQALNRMGIKSLLGSQDSIDILGNPKDLITTEKDQIYRAYMEMTAILGSVSQGALTFEVIPILEDKDDHVAHLTQAHNPKATEILKQLQEANFTPAMLAEMSTDAIEGRNELILKLGALASHISQHQSQLERFGSKRPEINRLKEETNAILQSAEGLMNSLQINLRALKQKQEETRLRLQNISPENEAEKMKQQTEQMNLQLKARQIDGQLAIANKIADANQQDRINERVSKARDREFEKQKVQLDSMFKGMELKLKDKEINVKSKQEKQASKTTKENK